MNKNFCSTAGLVTVLVSALFLSSCLPGFSKEAPAPDDVVLLKVDGKPVITKSEFYKELGGMVGQMDPMLLPKETQRKVLDDLSRFKLVVAAATKEGIENDAEYKKAYKEQTDRLKELLLSRIYEKKMFDNIVVPETELKADFDANKSKYVKEQGGVLVTAVSFEQRDKALAFYDKVKSKVSEFESLGKKEKAGKFKEFGRVGEQPAGATGYEAAAVPQAVRDAATKLTKLPAVDVVKEGKQTFVILASDKKEPVAYDYQEVRKSISDKLKVNKFMELRNKSYEDLKKKFTLEVNEEFFKEDKKEMAQEEETPRNDDENAGGGESL